MITILIASSCCCHSMLQSQRPTVLRRQPRLFAVILPVNDAHVKAVLICIIVLFTARQPQLPCISQMLPAGGNESHSISQNLVMCLTCMTQDTVTNMAQAAYAGRLSSALPSCRSQPAVFKPSPAESVSTHPLGSSFISPFLFGSFGAAAMAVSVS